VSLELSLAESLLQEGTELQGGEDAERARADALLVASELHARQAELRAHRHAHYDLAALSRELRARIQMLRGDRAATLLQLQKATEAANLWMSSGAAGGEGEVLDSIFIRLAIEALADFELNHHDESYQLAAQTLNRLQGREALRHFRSLGLSPALLAELADKDDLAMLLEELAKRSTQAMSAWSVEARRLAPPLASLAERLITDGPAWIAADPLLLEFLPGELPETATEVSAVMAPRELLLALMDGKEREAGALLELSATSHHAHVLPGESLLRSKIDACRQSLATPAASSSPSPSVAAASAAAPQALSPACQELHEECFSELGTQLAEARQLLVAAHGIFHELPYEALFSGKRVVRLPSLLSLPAIRLRAWQGQPKAHPAARDALPAGKGAHPEGADAESLAKARLFLDSGEALVVSDTGLEYGAPLTVPSSEPASPAEASKPPSPPKAKRPVQKKR